MLNGRYFHEEQSRFSCWTVEIFMMNDWDFHDERSRFSWWTVQIFMMNGPDFHDDRWWKVEIFIMIGPELLYCFGLNPGAGGEHLAIWSSTCWPCHTRSRAYLRSVYRFFVQLIWAPRFKKVGNRKLKVLNKNKNFHV